MPTCSRCGLPFLLTRFNKIYCSETCRSSVSDKRKIIRKNSNQICLNCKASFSGRKRKHCSDQCRFDYTKSLKIGRRPEMTTRLCIRCEREFQKPRSSQKELCSDECRKNKPEMLNGACLSCSMAINKKRLFCNKCLIQRRKDVGIKQRVYFEDSRELNRKKRRVARERNAPGLHTRQRFLLLRIWKIQGKSCIYCSNKADTIDHIIPLARGGSNNEGNLAPACRKCNSSKNVYLISEWKVRNGYRATAKTN